VALKWGWVDHWAHPLIAPSSPRALIRRPLLWRYQTASAGVLFAQGLGVISNAISDLRRIHGEIAKVALEAAIRAPVGFEHGLFGKGRQAPQRRQEAPRLDGIAVLESTRASDVTVRAIEWRKPSPAPRDRPCP
jgi:hypothetical protein